MTSGAKRQFGHYVLERQLGAGGMGIVYEACHQSNGSRKVALKLVRDAHLATRGDLTRFTLEAEAAARLDHPNIVRIHEVGEIEGQPYFSMDLIQGESLYVKGLRGDFAPAHPASAGAPKANQHRQEEIARLMAKIARAVHHAHERGILHRDLKPGNILIDSAGEPHLTDFGLAKILKPDERRTLYLTTPGDLIGTPNYMPPEQVSGKVITRASDIYSLGAMLYELLTGRPPFDGATALEMLRQIVEQAPVKPRSLEFSVARALETVCLKCLEKDPRHRYVSAEAVAEDLERWLGGQPIRAQRPTLVRRTREWVHRNPVGAALIITLCAGLSVALALLKTVNEQRLEIERERDQTFEEGLEKVNQLWKESSTREVTISAREVASLAGRSLAGRAPPRYDLLFGVNTGGEPSSTAHYYARWLSALGDQLEQALQDRLVFQIKLYKQFTEDEDALASGAVDCMVLSAVDFLNAQALAPGVTPIARVQEVNEAVIFARTNAGVRELKDLAGKTMVFPDPDLTMSVWAKARLVTAGLQSYHLGQSTDIADQGLETGHLVISFIETVTRVLRGEADAGVTYRERFERCKHLGLVMLDRFAETPNVLATRPGLAPALVGAFTNAVRTLERMPKVDLLTTHGAGPMVSVGNADFALLRHALELAGKFDGQLPGRQSKSNMPPATVAK